MSDDEWTTCHFCGTETNALGFEYNGERHWLEDCRPDLVEHEIGPLCTWPLFGPPYEHLNEKLPKPGCYAFQDRTTGEWGTEHIHFYAKESDA